MEAAEMWDGARFAARLLPNGASICIGAAMPVELVRALAAVAGVQVGATLHLERGDGSPYVIEVMEVRLEGVEIRAQGKRAATPEDATLPGYRFEGGRSLAPAEVAAAVGGVQ
jgi:hypothetical protein